MALGEIADLAVRLGFDDGNFSRGLKGATRSLGKFESSIGRVGKGAGQLSTGLARAGSIIAVGVGTGLAGAAKAAIDFEDAFAGVRKTVNEADLKAAGLTFEDIEKDIRDLAKTTPLAATELAGLAETAGALGVAAGDIDQFVETTALLGVTTNLSADEAADAFGRIGTILNLTGDEYEELADSIVALGNAGASTESEITEITKRFAAQAKQLGITKEEIVGLASVTASLGFEPERGGTALSRTFGDMATNIALANKKGKAFAKLVGEPIEDLQRKINQGEGLDIFLDVLEEIKGLSTTDANKVLKAMGVTSQSGRNIFIAMADNLPEVTKQLKVATEATGALSKEAQKRFDTVASKIAVFKNNLIDAAITIGQGMIPAIGRATEKLTEFLQQPENVTALKNLGADIGKAIDGIDWDEVVKGGKSLVSVMKSAFDWAKRLFDLFNSLPTELKGLLVGGLAVNKLSGGLVGAGLGNILGGAVKSALSTIPIFGKAFVQPVFVTNMGVGGLGGAAGAAGGRFGRPGVGGLLMTGLAIAGWAEAIALWDSTNQQSTAQAQAAQDNLTAMLAQKPTQEEMATSLLAVQNGIKEIQSNPLLALVQGEALDKLRSMEAQLSKELIKPQAAANATANANILPSKEGNNAGRPAPAKAPTPGVQAVTNAVKNAQSIATRENAAQKTELSNIKNSLATTRAVESAANSAQKAELGNIKNSVNTMNAQARASALAHIAVSTAGNLLSVFQSASQVLAQGSTTTAVNTNAAATRGVAPPITGAVYAIGSQIAGAIWAARPVIQSTTVIQKYNVTQRGGGTSDSRTAAGTGNV